MQNQLPPDFFFVGVAFHPAIGIVAGLFEHGLEIGAGQDGFQRACFEIDFPSKFFNQRHNEVKLMVVSADVHAMGKTAGMYRAVGGNI